MCSEGKNITVLNATLKKKKTSQNCVSYFYNDRVPHVDWNGKLPSYPQQAREAKEVVHHSTVRAKTTLLFLNLMSDNWPKPPFQHPKINFPREAEYCDTPLIGAGPPVPFGITLSSTPP